MEIQGTVNCVVAHGWEQRRVNMSALADDALEPLAHEVELGDIRRVLRSKGFKGDHRKHVLILKKM